MADRQTDFTVRLQTLQDTQRLASCLAAAVSTPLTIGLVGTLGSGKTQLTKFFCQSLGVGAGEVTSPTYVLVHRYVGRVTIYHVDLYRINSLTEAWDIGIDEFFESNCITIIEWADKFDDYLPEDHFRCEFKLMDDGIRVASIAAASNRGAEILREVSRLWSVPIRA